MIFLAVGDRGGGVGVRRKVVKFRKSIVRALWHRVLLIAALTKHRKRLFYAATLSGKQSEGCGSSLSTAGFTLTWNEAWSPTRFGPITLASRSTVELKSLACICGNSIVIVMSNDRPSHS
jgi:hypothetical protein